MASGAMTPRDFSRRLEEGTLPSLLLFEGQEEYLKRQALEELRKKLLPEGLEELNEARLTAPETEEIIAAAETLPFMADRRIVFLRDHPALTGRGEADEKLLEYLPHVPPTAVVLFYCVLPVRQRKIKNLIQKQGGLVDFSPLSERELSAFVTRSFHDLGRECDERTAEFLVFTVGKDMNQLKAEITKIAAWHPEEQRLNPADVRALATPSTESRVFDIVDAVLAGQDEKAFASLRDLLRNGESRMLVTSMLLRQFRLMQHVKIMQYEKRSAAYIAEALGTGSFIARKYQQQAAVYTGRQVKEAVTLCLDTDLAVKSGRLREEGALEALMLKLLMLRRQKK